MKYALSEAGKKTSIFKADPFKDYFCPLCHERLIQKRGSKYVFHFAHYPNKNCTDNWHYEEMSKWHRDWQDCFLEEQQEVILEARGVKHIADVIYKKWVIEFQHSKISNAEFNDRNAFYNSLGYRVIWIFDFYDNYNSGFIQQTAKENILKYLNPARTFTGFDASSKSVLLFFQKKRQLTKRRTFR